MLKDYKGVILSFHHVLNSGFQFIVGTRVDMVLVHESMRPLLLKLGDYKSLNLNVIQRLSSLTQLFPNTFNEKLCEQLLVRTSCKVCLVNMQLQTGR